MRKQIIIGGCVLSGILLAGVLAYGLRGGAVRIDKYSVSGHSP